MQLGRLDHVNLHTANVDGMVEWYERILGMENGKRPPFPNPGAWLYSDGHPFVHLVSTDRELTGKNVNIEHFAFSATGLKDFVDVLNREDENYQLRKVPDTALVQVNLWDPDGNHIHIDFHADEAEGLDV